MSLNASFCSGHSTGVNASIISEFEYLPLKANGIYASEWFERLKINNKGEDSKGYFSMYNKGIIDVYKMS